MGLFEKIFGTRKQPNYTSYYETLSGYAPSFNRWTGGTYESELCRSAVDAIARNISKLGVRLEGAANSRLRTLLERAPNASSTWSQFLYRLATIYYVQDTAFIVPVFDGYGDMTGIYPICPERWDLVRSNGDNTPYIRFTFGNGKTAAIELDKVGILVRHQYASDYFGDSNEALRPLMELINIQNQGITEGIKNAASYRFMARITHAISPDDLKNERERFNENTFSGEGGGMLLFPNTYSDIKQIDSKPFVIDAEQMKQIQTRIFNYFGVNENILQSSATDEQLDSFWESVVEPFAIQCTEVFDRMIYSPRERAQGNHIRLTANRLQYMSTSHKIQLAQQLGDRGMIMIDEIRELFNWAPLPDGAGQRAPIRGEYYMAGENQDADKNES